ncbi:hypothetical protein [Proteiniborus sp. MB09-C3]|uniref:hypothetical protein n=1 Tax=Proteiniborus sp. MB09-C3 TaxID=3050072 RepID=UPI0025547689|nr:hypothetical protein [Proteiniborus sp. MB09-C3]WIV12168.1 hypothetical protein QO263_00160 [Proteiniborus sp. MB09-C3]
MTQITKQIIEMIDMLPEKEQILAFEFIKRMVLAWDNDFTKLTPSERETLKKADAELINNEFLSHSDVWS